MAGAGVVRWGRVLGLSKMRTGITQQIDEKCAGSQNTPPNQNRPILQRLLQHSARCLHSVPSPHIAIGPGR